MSETKKRRPLKPLSPKQARTGDEVCSLRTDNFDASSHWILTDGHKVTISAQVRGEMPTASITIPRRTFNRLIDWYLRPQRRTRG